IRLEWPFEARSCRPDSASQTRTVWSSPAEASRRPSGLNATRETGRECPTSVRRSSPDAASHTRTTLSSPQEASRRPSGLKATPAGAGRRPEDGHLVAPNHPPVLTAGGAPQAHRLVSAGRGEPAAVGAERDAAHPVLVPLVHGRLPARVGRPNPGRAVPAGGG